MDTTVQQVQRRLIALGFPMPKFGADGDPGSELWAATQKALDELEALRGSTAIPAPVATVPPASGQPFYMGAGVKLSDADFAALASKHGIEEAKIRAVNEVEAAGKGFTSSGAITCLYEPHIAYKYSSGAVRDALVAAGLSYKTWKAGSYPKSSYDRIDRGTAIAGAEVAALATSWGLGQIMGFNYKACGYPTAVDMVKGFAKSEANQLEGMINFMKANPAMLAALKAGNWADFAKLYNGAGYAANKYDTKLAAAYARHRKG